MPDTKTGTMNDSEAALRTGQPQLTIVPRPRPGPGRKTSKDPVWISVADGIWRNTKSKRGKLYERPKINGKFTYKKLGTANVQEARKELARRITERAGGKEPTAKTVPTPGKTAGDVIRFYANDGYPDKLLNERPTRTKASEATNCKSLLRFWDTIPLDQIVDKTSDEFKIWRVKEMNLPEASPRRGTRMVDSELNTLTNAFKYAKRRDLIRFNPLSDHPKFHDPKSIRHCRECMPDDADQLHERASHLFKHPKTVALGFQYLFEAYTGLRSFELLHLGEDQFGTLTEDGKYMRCWRAKGQHSVNPYVFVHEGVAELMKAHASWKAAKFPYTKIFFPSSEEPSKPVGGDSLAHALGRLPGRKMTSHGGRAFYVTVRRSWGIPDNQIAHEIGHTSGGATLHRVYGGVPANWLLGEGPKMRWLPSPKQSLAWEEIVACGWNFRSLAVEQPQGAYHLPNASLTRW